MISKLILINILITFVNSSITCRNEQTGQPADWFTLIKLPKKTTIEEDSQINNPFIEFGTAYTFMSNESIEWQLSSLSINDSRSFAAKTLEPLYDNSSNIGYILYNDQADQLTLTKGHTKGVLLFDETSAIWIVHSIPHFPPKPSDSKYAIQPPKCLYGQSMLCISVSIDKLEQIGQQLLFNYPQVYDHYIPEHLNHLTSLANLARVVNGDYVTMAPWFSLNHIETINGEQMLSFAKFTNFNDDLYSGLVAPNLTSNLLTETWNNGVGTFDSNCSAQYQVHNIEQVKFDSLGMRYSVHRDHSKWVVTNGTSSKVACIGDINRQEDQLKRAGGTLCFVNNDKVWAQFNNLVDQVEPCKKNRSFRKMKKLHKKKKYHRRLYKASNSNDIIILLG